MDPTDCYKSVEITNFTIHFNSMIHGIVRDVHSDGSNLKAFNSLLSCFSMYLRDIISSKFFVEDAYIGWSFPFWIFRDGVLYGELSLSVYLYKALLSLWLPPLWSFYRELSLTSQPKKPSTHCTLRNSQREPCKSLKIKQMLLYKVYHIEHALNKLSSQSWPKTLLLHLHRKLF